MKKYSIIAIEREYASGGREIGERVAKALGFPSYGREILEMAAKRSGRSTSYFEHLEETATGSLLYSMSAMGQAARFQESGIPTADTLAVLESQIIEELARVGNCIIIGRCASWVLREREDVLTVFVHAPWEARVERAVSRYGVPAAEAESVLKKFDKRRAGYYRANAGRAWDDKAGYHLMLDSGKLGVDACVKIILDAAGRS